MRSLKILGLPAILLIFAAFYADAAAQASRADFNRAQTYDVQNYTIRTRFDRAKKKVVGDTTVSLKPLAAGFRTFELDAVNLSFQSVELGDTGTKLAHKNGGSKISITLDRAYSPEETVSVRMRYTATPVKGVYFVPGEDKRSDQIWTQGEPDEARHWFPSFDFPSDKATTEQFLTVQADETAIANGELIGKTPNGDKTVTWHYRMPVPHTTYLVSFVIGKYSKVEDRYKDIPLGFYVYPGKEQTAKNAFGETAKMMAVFEELTGVPFPFNKYDQTIVSNFQFGGMENITATTMADTEIFLADFEFGKGLVSDLVAHELAHSWFGNLVTCKNWAELWLNEGFATFMEAAYRERANGREDYRRKIRADTASFLINDAVNRRKHGLFNQRAGEVSSLFDNAAITYNKGGAVVHMLREQVGNDAFWKAINTYLTRHKHGSVETTDLRKAMEEASGQDLKWFFDQWVYGLGAPSITVNQNYNAAAKTLTITFTQTHAANAQTPAAFRLPLDVVVRSSEGDKKEKIELTKRIQTLTVSTALPKEVQIDPDEKVVLKKINLRPMVRSVK